jgi:hypothetical protein
MLYPIIPIYLKSIGFSMVFTGVLEDFAEAITRISKAYFGKKLKNMTKQELHLAFVETTFRVLKSDIFTNNNDL